MPEESGGDEPKRVTSKTTPSQRSCRRNRNCGGCPDQSTFKGTIEGYETHVYNVSRRTGSDAFNVTTRKLLEYISRKLNNTSEFLKAMNPEDLGF